MSFFRNFVKNIPNPFKYFRNRLKIEVEWQQFKHHIHPHRFKIYFVLLVISYPIYKPYALELSNFGIKKAGHLTNYILGQQMPPFQVTQNFAKSLIGSVLNDENVRQQALGFVNVLIQDDKFVQDILQLLLSALKSQPFMGALKEQSKQLAVDLLNNDQLQVSLKSVLIKTVSSQQVKNSFIKLIQDAFSSQTAVETMINLLLKGITNNEVKGALSEAVLFSVQQVLKDEQTLNQLRIFIFFLLRKFENDDQIKGMMDILFAKGLGLTRKKKDSQLQKIMKGKIKKTDNLE